SVHSHGLNLTLHPENATTFSRRMVLLINRSIVCDLPKDTNTFYRLYPSLKESARPLLSQTHKSITSLGSLYVLQREYAVVSPNDKYISIVGTDNTTTCCSVIVRHSGSGVTSLGHFDGSGLENAVSEMVRKVQEYSTISGELGVLELHIVGGFLDKRGYSETLAMQLLYAFHRQLAHIHLVTACTCDLNNVLRGNTNYPIIYGISVNIKTGEIFPSTFVEKGPEFALRSSRIFAGGSSDMQEVYETQMFIFKINPFNYEPMRGIELWLNEGDDFILQHLSTSPEAEPPHFVTDVKSALSFIHQNPFPSVTVFPENRPLYFRKDEFGQWIPIRI
ncbi:protein N-terminal asparagine amidohydrolase-like protein, partial [Dinothrombium tinctorium]